MWPPKINAPLLWRDKWDNEWIRKGIKKLVSSQFALLLVRRKKYVEPETRFWSTFCIFLIKTVVKINLSLSLTGLILLSGIRALREARVRFFRSSFSLVLEERHHPPSPPFHSYGTKQRSPKRRRPTSFTEATFILVSASSNLQRKEKNWKKCENSWKLKFEDRRILRKKSCILHLCKQVSNLILRQEGKNGQHGWMYLDYPTSLLLLL